MVCRFFINGEGEEKSQKAQIIWILKNQFSSSRS